MTHVTDFYSKTLQAGLDPTRLRLALEPEAASLWVQTLTQDFQLAFAEVGTKFMVIDLGGIFSISSQFSLIQ